MIHETENAFKVVTKHDKLKGIHILTGRDFIHKLNYFFSNTEAQFHLRVRCSSVQHFATNPYNGHAVALGASVSGRLVYTCRNRGCGVFEKDCFG